MKPILFIFFTITLFSNILMAQTDTVNKKALTIYYNPGLYKTVNYSNNIYGSYSYSEEKIQYKMNYLSIAFLRQFKNSNSHEIEVTPLKVGFNSYRYTLYDSIKNRFETRNGVDTGYLLSSLRYQYNYMCVKNPIKKIKPYAGFSIYFSYFINRNNPLVGVGNRNTIQHFGVGVAIIPGLSFALNSKVTLDLNIPLQFCEVIYEINNINAASMADQDMHSNRFFGEWFPTKYFFRLGVSVII